MHSRQLETFLASVDKEIYSTLNKIDSYQSNLDAPDEGLDRLTDVLESAQDIITQIVYLRDEEGSNATEME